MAVLNAGLACGDPNMVSKLKALERERARLRRVQNPSQVDFRRIRRLRMAQTRYWKLKKKTQPRAKTDEAKPKREKKKAEPEPEPEFDNETLAEDLEELYTYDEDLDGEEDTSDEDE